MNELELIKLLTAGLTSNPSVVVGPGDDCAVLRIDPLRELVLFKTDSVIEGVHFTSDCSGHKLGHKALARCLSDVAAMGGRPLAALVALATPAAFDPARLKAIYDGLNQLAARYGVAVCGGETCLCPDRLVITVSVLGLVEPEKCVLRSGAKPGDAIFVTGELGGSILGRHLEFEPRLTEARWLVEHFPVTAMIDLSDGLATDLKRILAASGTGAELLADAIPISPAARQKTRMPKHPDPVASDTRPLLPGTPLVFALTDGEDYELLFTVPPGFAVNLMDRWRERFPQVRLSCIGKITAEKTVTIRDRLGRKPLALDGYIHFQ